MVEVVVAFETDLRHPRERILPDWEIPVGGHLVVLSALCEKQRDIERRGRLRAVVLGQCPEVLTATETEQDLVVGSFAATDTAVLLAAALVLLVASQLLFRRRDI